MYRLILLDDEEIVIKGIQKVFHIPDYGFEVVGAFMNPVKALEQLTELKPDLIITDVKMPQMDGLEFSSEAKKLLPDVEIVILSGYDDFSYAQAAVKIGVSDYLLKPIKKDDFISMMNSLHEKIEEKQSKENQYKHLRELVQNSYIELKNKFYLDLSENNHFDEGLYDTLKMHGQEEFTDQQYVMIYIDVNEIAFDGDFMSEIGKLTQQMEMILSDYGKIIDFWSDESIYIIVYGLEENLYEDMIETANGAVDMRIDAGMKLAMSVSHIRNGVRTLFEARNDCFRRLFMNEANIDATSEANPISKEEINITIPYNEIETLFRAISVNDIDGIQSAADVIYAIPENNIHVLYRDYFSSISFLILLRIYQMQNKYNAPGKIVKQEMMELKNLRNEYPGSEEQKMMIVRISNEMAGLISTQKIAAPSKMVQAALEYINKHFGENISLQDVADNINISKNYLCDIFKKEIGVTFINYVTKLRIEKAKEFLANTDMKMYEVSNAVGYNDYAYFSQIFKKHTGTTLSSYRKKLN